MIDTPISSLIDTGFFTSDKHLLRCPKNDIIKESSDHFCQVGKSYISGKSALEHGFVMTEAGGASGLRASWCIAIVD